MALLETKNLSKEFERGSRKFFAVQNVNFSIGEGEYAYIVGRSGSGKSTLLSLLSGILEPTGGEVLVEGNTLFQMNDEKRSHYRNSLIGYVPQSLGTVPNLSVLDNVRFPYFFEKRDGDAVERATMLLDMMGILHLKDDFCNKLSGGELKRVLLARALMNEPKILMADEPTSDLDTVTTKEIMEVLHRINEKGVALLIVTHETELLQYGDVCYRMQDGILTRDSDE